MSSGESADSFRHVQAKRAVEVGAGVLPGLAEQLQGGLNGQVLAQPVDPPLPFDHLCDRANNRSFVRRCGQPGGPCALSSAMGGSWRGFRKSL
jgi:hypothetical protein